jgi:hypothetical protein
MARKQGSKGKPLSRKIQRWLGLLLVASGIFLFAALVTYDASAFQKSVKAGHVHFPAAKDLAQAALATGSAKGWFASAWPNAGGALGLFFAVSVLIAFGWVAGWTLPIALACWGWNRLSMRPLRALTLRTLATLPLAVTLAAIAEAMSPHHGWGGNLGEGIWTGVQSSIGALGGSLFLAAAGIGFFFLEAETWDGRRGVWTRNVLHHFTALTTYLVKHAFALLGYLFRLALRAFKEAVRSLWSLARWMSRRPWEHGAHVDGSLNDAAPTLESKSNGKIAPPQKAQPEEWIPPRITRPEPALAIPVTPPVRTPLADTVVVAGLTHTPTRDLLQEAAREALQGEPVVGHQDLEAAVMEARRHAVTGKKTVAAKRGKMILPGVDLLDDVPEAASPVPEAELEDNSKLLTQTLLDFGVSGRVGEVHPGPVITRYEYIPGPGVRVAQILNRQDDLALKLRASRIRILAPIPGKAAVGIEVPNRTPAPIFLRRLMETRAFQEAAGPLPLALGKDIGGMPVTTELSRMPHLLIAGTTGSGKSVCLNALISSLLLKRTPSELRLLMIDPKMLELPMYDGVPHLLTNVVTDAKASVRSFKWALSEMERRYRILAARGCRNLGSYNDKFDREGPKQEGEEKLPYIVIIIDELADLMITSGREV